MSKIDLYKKMLEEERITEEELLSICTEEELDEIFPPEKKPEGITEEKESALTEILTLIQVRDAYMNSSAQIGFHAKKDDPMVEYLHKTMLTLLKELYGE